jgi:hypothetical protein
MQIQRMVSVMKEFTKSASRDKLQEQGDTAGSGPAPQGRSGFEKYNLDNPCHPFEAPCCKMLLIPYQTPQTFMDLDYIRYMLGFPGIAMILSPNGTWQVQVEQTCRHLVAKDNTCKLHHTPNKPKTCAFFNPYNCFYKRNFSEKHPPKITRINAVSFEILINQIEFDDLGNITSVPQFEAIAQINKEHATVSDLR